MLHLVLKKYPDLLEGKSGFSSKCYSSSAEETDSSAQLSLS